GIERRRARGGPAEGLAVDDAGAGGGGARRPGDAGSGGGNAGGLGGGRGGDGGGGGAEALWLVQGAFRGDAGGGAAVPAGRVAFHRLPGVQPALFEGGETGVSGDPAGVLHQSAGVGLEQAADSADGEAAGPDAVPVSVR